MLVYHRIVAGSLMNHLHRVINVDCKGVSTWIVLKYQLQIIGIFEERLEYCEEHERRASLSVALCMVDHYLVTNIRVDDEGNSVL
jgi:hypothetical protein